MFFKRLACASLILTLVLPPGSSTYADQGRSGPGGISIAISEDLPEGGALDRFHRPLENGDAVSNTLYVLRNTAVEDLLHTRLALKQLLGGSHRLQRLKKNPSVGFEVPASVLTLYGLDRGSDIGRAIRALQDPALDSKYDLELRGRLVLGLAYVSALLARIDQQSKFIQKDFFEDSTIAFEFYESQVKPMLAGPSGDGHANVSALTNLAIHSWLDRHGMASELRRLAQMREQILDRYHLLAVEVGGRPLYESIYSELSGGFGFPSREMAQPVLDDHLPSGTMPIRQAFVFEKAQQNHFSRLAENPAAAAQALLPRLNPLIDRALLTSLEANTERLSALTESAHYSGDEKSELFQLGGYEELWPVALQKYSYLKSAIPFEAARAEIKSVLDRQERSRRRMRYSLYGAGIGLGLVGVAASFGSVGPILELTAQQWLIGSGVLVSGSAAIDHRQSRQGARRARMDFDGSATLTTSAKREAAISLNESNYQLLIGSLIFLGAELPVLSMLERSASVVKTAGGKLYELSEPQLTALRGAVARIAKNEVLAPMGRALMTVVREILSALPRGERLVMTLDEAVPVVAERLQMAPAQVWAKLGRNPYIGKLAQGFKDRILTRPDFLATLIREEVTTFALTGVNEYQIRREHLKDQLGYVSFDVLSTSFMTGAIVYILMPPIAAGGPVAAAGIETMFSKGLSAKERLDHFSKVGRPYAVVGFTSSAAAQGILEGWDLVRDPHGKPLEQRGKDILKNAAYGGAFMAVSCNVRYQFMNELQERIGMQLADAAKTKTFMYLYSGANGYAAEYHYIKLARVLGIQEVAPEKTAFEVDDLGGAYLKLGAAETSQASEDAGYLFDFLKQ